MNMESILSGLYRVSYPVIALAILASLSRGQEAPRVDPTQPAAAQSNENNNPPAKEGKRILWIIPNYRTYPSLHHYEPLATREKFTIATQASPTTATAPPP